MEKEFVELFYHLAQKIPLDKMINAFEELGKGEKAAVVVGFVGIAGIAFMATVNFIDSGEANKKS